MGGCVRRWRFSLASMIDDASRAKLLHPATRIVLWILFAVVLAVMDWRGLAMTTALLAVALAGLRDRTCLAMLRRARWLLLSLLLIYGFATPGAELTVGGVPLLMSREGLQSGAVQAWRLVAMIAGLALLLALTPAPQLIAGIYAILSPLRATGVQPERAAVRLSLTLDYARALGRPKEKSWREALMNALEPDSDPPARVVIERPPFTWHDAAALAVGAMMLLAAW